MDWIPYVSMAIQAVSTVSQVAGGIGQANQASREAKREAQAISTQTAMERAAAARQHEAILAKNEVRSAASGLDAFSGTPYEFNLSQAFNAGLNEASLQYAGDLRRRAALMGGYNARATRGQTIAKGIGQFGSILGNWYGISRTGGVGGQDTLDRFDRLPGIGG